MGVTLPHERLLIDFAVMFKEPATASDKGLAYQPVSLSNVGWVRQNFNANLDNLRRLDEQTALDEVMLFRRAGGQTVVDPTNVSLSAIRWRWRGSRGPPASTSSWAPATT